MRSEEGQNGGKCGAMLTQRTLFTMLHALGIATRKLSVRPLNVWIVTKQKQNSAQIFIPRERTFILVLQTRRMTGGGERVTPST